MKNVKNALRMSIVFFILISCDKNSAPGGPVIPPPPPPPAPVAAKISSVEVSPFSSFVLTGMPVNTSVIFTVNATGTPAPTYSVNGTALSGNSYVAPASYESKSYDFGAYNSAGSDVRKVDVTVTIDPTFQKLAGTNMAGRSFRMIAATGQPVGGGTVTNLMTLCLEDDVFTFWPNGRTQISYGSAVGCTTGLSQPVSYWFNPSTMLYNTIGTIPVQPDKRVEFPSSNTMVHSYDYNGSRYTLTYQAE